MKELQNTSIKESKSILGTKWYKEPFVIIKKLFVTKLFHRRFMGSF